MLPPRLRWVVEGARGAPLGGGGRALWLGGPDQVPSAEGPRWSPDAGAADGRLRRSVGGVLCPRARRAPPRLRLAGGLAAGGAGGVSLWAAARRVQAGPLV